MSATSSDAHLCLWTVDDSTGTTTTTCQVQCMAGFNTAEDLHSHINTTHITTVRKKKSSPLRPDLACRWVGCGLHQRPFGKRNHLLIHLRSHMAIHEFDCKVCGHLFKFKHDMRRHEARCLAKEARAGDSICSSNGRRSRTRASATKASSTPTASMAPMIPPSPSPSMCSSLSGGQTCSVMDSPQTTAGNLFLEYINDQSVQSLLNDLCTLSTPTTPLTPPTTTSQQLTDMDQLLDSLATAHLMLPHAPAPSTFEILDMQYPGCGTTMATEMLASQLLLPLELLDNNFLF